MYNGSWSFMRISLVARSENMKALVLFSGGLDSSVCLGLAVKEYGSSEVLALSIYYGQKHKKS